MIEKTVVLIKPDGVERKLIGEIISRFERVGLKLLAMKMIKVKEDHVKKHYPSTRTEWLIKIGEKTLDAYKQFGKDAGETLGTSDPLEIGKKINEWNVGYLVSGPVIAMLWEGNHAVSIIRKLVGFTHPNLADSGSIRGQYSVDSTDLANAEKRAARNLIHASGNEEEAEFERKLWFKENEIYEY